MQAGSTQQHSVPATYADQLVQLVRRWGVGAAELLSGFGLSETDVQDAQRRLPLGVFVALIERARTLTGEPGLGFYLGLEKRVSMYGFLGFAAMSAASLRDALELFIRFTPTLTTSVSLALRVEGPVASITIHEHADMGSAHDVALLSLMIGMRQIGKTLTGRDIGHERADMTLPEPPYFQRFKHLAPHTRFDQPVSRVVFDAASLDWPLAHADRTALQLARQQCEHALDALGYDGNLIERVRRAIPAAERGGFRSLEEVASNLALSPRTLKRRLAARGTSFTTLLERERCESALLLLRSHKVSLESVAERLGYSTLSGFVRAFHRWTGRTPAAYRRGRTALAL
jgi:AraC-like DNA-binding protein